MGMHASVELEDLIISQPDLQPGLTDVIPPGEEPSYYLNRYHSADKVRCAFCDSHMPHNRGFTVRMEDGRTALCGKDCAAKYFGKAVADSHEEELEKQIRRATKRRIVQRTVDGVPEALALITPELVAMERLASAATSSLAGEFRHSGIRSGLSEQGHYELKEERRRWVEREDEFGQVRRVPIDETRVVLRVDGASLLRAGEGFASMRFERVQQALQQLLAVETTKELSDNAIDRMTDARSRIITDIRNVVRFLDLCATFYTKDNIKALSKLTRHVKSTVESVALHKRPYGHDLIIVPEGYVEVEGLEGLGRQKEVYPLPDFAERPSVETLLAPLYQDET